MRVVNVAELKNKLSAYLDEVERGEEILVKNRKKAVARITPASPSGTMKEELVLVSEGKLRLPEKRLSERFLEKFLAAKMAPVSSGTSVEAIVKDRDEG